MTSATTLSRAAAMLGIVSAATRNLRSDATAACGRPVNEGLAIHRARVDALFVSDGPVERFNALASDAGVDPVVMGSGLWPAVHVQVVTRMAESANAAAIGALAA